MSSQRIVVIGASSGGIEALRTLVGGLPRDFAAPICIVVHTSAESPGLLHKILGTFGALEATSASTGMKLEAGHIYVAPPDHHLLIEPGGLCLGRGPKENRFRPAIDPLFRSAAQVYGPAAVGVILTGNLDDGSSGLRTLKQLGGVAIVQHPRDALFPAMPINALRHVAADHVVTLADMPRVLIEVVGRPVYAKGALPTAALDLEIAIAKEDKFMVRGVEHIGEPSVFACPDCHGVLMQLKERGILRFRCHTGHAYSAQSLLAALNEGVEDALWSAVRAVEEARLLLERFTQHESGFDDAENSQFREQLAHVTAQMDLLREIATQPVGLTPTQD